MIDLSQFDSLCGSNQKIIISEENHCKHTANNVDLSDVRQFSIDGYVITGGDEQRCDFLLLNDTKKTAYYIELKGSDIRKAIDQIKNTERLVRDSIKEYNPFYRIVYKSGTHNVHSNKVIQWKEKCGRDAKSKKLRAVVSQTSYSENI